jgi:hypothetical protein
MESGSGEIKAKDYFSFDLNQSIPCFNALTQRFKRLAHKLLSIGFVKKYGA